VTAGSSGRNDRATHLRIRCAVATIEIYRWGSAMIDPKWLFQFGLMTVGVLDIVLATLLISSFLEG
jgi:hypothetical protein